ncbi:uncharacterized protein K489DRAFT_377990 [Dissoconium aciculare CBS 342.82]|jgi:hypothetical protein|uniref:Uncharacterized protein n=1 Tax=Dissoconium aciculare CBS 342.82 TaxID=1314786 RepID=A0A6J3MBR6_9PEZI|nr:uncharacterized protein K489DRAFT_377990 [Dissoconium aciculare CBS 342.82]KAF1825440.1 hypothetical protein K489DRAFT_377990 [Dissoconium aciculare CBS 342.82]
MRSPTVRKITGPRPMGSRSPAPAQPVQHYEVGGTVRRKPVARSEGEYIISPEILSACR